MKLRDYQKKAIDDLRRQIQMGNKRPVLVLPTGAGKSVIFGSLIKSILSNNKKVLWVVHRRNLVLQMGDVLKKFGIEPGLIMSEFQSELSNPCQLCTVQTYSRRLALENTSFFVNADVVLIDEAHRSLSPTYVEIIEKYSGKIIIGCTATPVGPGGRGMGEVYNTIVEGTNVRNLTNQGFLSRARYFAPAKIDVSGVKVKMGDYVVKQLEDKVNQPKLNGDIVENWLKLAENRKTIVFCVNVAHSIAVKDEFIKRGVSAEHLDARSSDDEREDVFRRMSEGLVTVVCNVGLYQEGLDVPDVGCVVMARPTKSLGLYRQCCGRGLRPTKAYEDCLIIDHGNVIEENGFLDEDFTWSLDGKILNQRKKEYEKKQAKKTECKACGLVFEKKNRCPDCGSPVKSFGRKIETTDTELKELRDYREPTIANKRRYYGMLKQYVYERGYNPKMVNAKYRATFGIWPHANVKSVENDRTRHNIFEPYEI